MPLNETYGKYTPVPHVVIDRCKLSSEIKWTYVQLYHVCWETNGLYSGSYSKLAETLRTTKNKVYRMIKALKDARMLKISEDSNKLSLTLNSVPLWILNGLYEIGVEVPYWTNVITTLDSVLKIERKGTNITPKDLEITSIDLDSVLKIERVGLNLERITSFLSQYGLNLERNVLFLERLKSAIKALEKPPEGAFKKTPIISNGNIPTNNNKNAFTQTAKTEVDTTPQVNTTPGVNAEWVVTKTEELRRKTYTDQQRPKELDAAKKIVARKPDLTEDEFIRVFNKRNDKWWQEHVGLLNVTHLAATPKDQNDIRFMLILDQLTEPIPLRVEDKTHVGPYRRIGKKIS